MPVNTGGKMIRGYTLVASTALFVASVVSAQSGKTSEAAASPAGDHSKSISIHQEVDFTASPQWLYEALLDSKKFSAFSGRAAQIKRQPGGTFSLFGGHIVGRNVELVPNRRIVQAWRVVDWPEGVYSMARFELKTRESGTRLVFDHIGFPEGLRDHLAEGWEANYWALLKKAQ
jgi:activator of HSP90 ATPase